MKVLVLGGRGFVGSNVVEILRESDHEATPISKRDGLDLTDYKATRATFEKHKPEAIVNVAANVGSLNYVTEQAATVFDQNMRMLLNVFRAAQEVLPESVLVTPIANCGYPGNLVNYVEDKFWEGKVHQSVLSYGSTRRMIDVLSECYLMQHGYKSVNFFVPNMYGPYDSTDPNKAHALNALISKTVKAKREGKNELEVWGSGVAIREWLYAPDFGEIVKLALDKHEDNVFNETFNVAQNFGLSVRNLVEIIVEESGFEGEIVWNRNMPDGAPRKVMDDARFRKVFPDFEFMDFREGIRATSHYYESVYPY